jgi:hypothetical protein
VVQRSVGWGRGIPLTLNAELFGRWGIYSREAVGTFFNICYVGKDESVLHVGRLGESAFFV